MLSSVFRDSAPLPHPILLPSTLATLELSDLKKHQGLPLTLQRRTTEVWRGKAQPEKHPRFQPFVHFCAFILCIVFASPRCTSNSPWPFRCALVLSISMTPFMASSGKRQDGVFIFLLNTHFLCYLFTERDCPVFKSLDVNLSSVTYQLCNLGQAI